MSRKYKRRHPSFIVNRSVVRRAAYAVHSDDSVLSLRRDVHCERVLPAPGNDQWWGVGSPYKCGCLVVQTSSVWKLSDCISMSSWRSCAEHSSTFFPMAFTSTTVTVLISERE